MRIAFSLVALAALAGCGGSDAPAQPQNDAARVAQQIERQAQQMILQTEDRTGAIEQALENEGAVIFDNRDNLLNEKAAEPAAASAARNRSR